MQKNATKRNIFLVMLMFLSNKKVRLNIIRKPEFRADRPQQEVEEGGGGGPRDSPIGNFSEF